MESRQLFGSTSTGTAGIIKAPYDPKRHRYQTKAAFLLTTFVVISFTVLSLLFAPAGNVEIIDELQLRQHKKYEHRHLEDRDYATFSCNHLYESTPYRGKNQCSFAKTCNDGNGVWAPWVFCHNNKLSTTWLCVIISPFIILWLLILFRVLGSTAEDYFSPSLEMFSLRMGLPPRFAGVTLLALGNGAADVSSSINAIKSDAESGYLLSLGALTGAAMFVGGVVAAVVVIVAGGVPCRGALVRDVFALFFTICVVWWHLSKGKIGPEAISLFLSLYGVFVVLVLVADVYHRGVVIPRIEAEGQHAERGRQLEQENNAQQTAGEAMNDLAAQTETETATNSSNTNNNIATNKSTFGANALSTVLGALSNYDNQENNAQQQLRTEGEGWGLDAEDLDQDRPVLLHGSRGILRGSGADPQGSNTNNTDSPYAILEDNGDRVCADPNFLGRSAGTWKAAWHDGKEELRSHVNKVWEDIVWNGDVNPVDKFLLICELPFTLLRQATIAIPCEGYYCRALVALSLASSPIWLAFYLATEYQVNFLAFDAFFYLFVVLLVGVSMGGLVLRYAPGGDGVMDLGVSAPIAMYGFIIAATWIDTIADHLVGVLDFIGIVLHIPGPIIGLTILAWGNSIADLSANVAMARKGLANMAMTACFAGPVFNILVGLGLGFSGLSAKTGEETIAVKVTEPIITGFVFIMLNSICILFVGVFLSKGTIVKQYGYIALGLYSLYVISCIGFEYVA